MNPTDPPPQLIPCPDGTYADPSLGCTRTPEGLVNPHTGIAEWLMQAGSGLMSVVAIAATISLLYGAIKYASNRGNEERLNEAKRILFWSVFGLLLALLGKWILIEIARVING